MSEVDNVIKALEKIEHSLEVDNKEMKDRLM